jgi:hypothetical protein
MHITIGHPEIADYYYEMLEAIESPEVIYEGINDALIAIKKINESSEKFIIVIYKEISQTDGFIITAYISNQEQKFNKKKIIWKQQS